MTTQTEPRTAAAVAARRQAAALMLDRIRDVLGQMRRERSRVTFAAVARRADVSRTFLYHNGEARRLVEDAAESAAGQTVKDRTEKAAHAEATWRERALNAEEIIKAANLEVRAQRAQIATLLGRIRDLESSLPADAVQRIVSENHSLKIKVRQDNKTLEDRLKAARDNNRFLDKRIADLETELLQEREGAGAGDAADTRKR
ncbi:DUF6262 family protein [Streptomyces sp. V4I2]|uniref:DUF6262 family protein n=1 Tax=Streptomyces sp. V4I2 TaxID=3042280 RepID=UPI002782E6C3|nr:DUF6262 family protein [Streptomyces sp. V4I2]MDQ1051677.1 hypothetical protein [Streptomyces sp. V4I2]